MSDLEQPSASPDSAPGANAPAPAELQTTEATGLPDTPQGEQADPNAPADEQADLLSLLPEDDGLEEFEHEGEKFKIPAKIKPLLMFNADYTRKTQDLAEEKRTVQSERAALQQQAAFQQQHIAEVAGLVSIDRQLQQFSQLDWDRLITENPQHAQKLDRQVRELQGQRAQIAQSLTQKQQQQALIQQQEIAKRTQDGQRELERDIKGWSPELRTKLSSYGKSQGFPEEVLAQVTEPAFVKVLNKARQWDELIAQRTAKATPAKPAAPVTRIAPRASTAIVDEDKLSADEWRKRRETQLAEKRKKR